MGAVKMENQRGARQKEVGEEGSMGRDNQNLVPFEGLHRNLIQ